jgi:hypothetical protein
MKKENNSTTIVSHSHTLSSVIEKKRKKKKKSRRLTVREIVDEEAEMPEAKEQDLCFFFLKICVLRAFLVASPNFTH